MRRVVTQLLRVACLAYIAVLWISLIPTQVLDYQPGLSIDRVYARSMFRSIGLSPGTAIFTGSPGEWKIAANCLQVAGETARGKRLDLYSSECRNRDTFRLRNAPFDQALQEMTRRKIEPPIRAGSLIAEILLNLSDYYCHSPLVERPRLERVILKQTIYARSAWSGSTLRTPAMWCAMSCAEAVPGSSGIPQCEPRGEITHVGVRAAGR